MGDTSNGPGHLRRDLPAPRPHLDAQGSSKARSAAKGPQKSQNTKMRISEIPKFEFCDFSNFGNTAHV